MKIKTSELSGAALDWAVARAGKGAKNIRNFVAAHADRGMYRYSTNWSEAGPIIEEHGIEILCNVSAEQAKRFIEGTHADWFACMNMGRSKHYHGLTPLIAAMRCYVTSKLGDEVDVPEELTN